MNETTTPCLFCQSPITVPDTGRLPKYCSDAHRMAHKRANKDAVKAIKSSPTTPPPTYKTPPNSSLIGSDGIDYTDPYKVLPANVACYMPVQSHQSKDQLHGRSIPQSIPHSPTQTENPFK
jgi:hypothetical protein